MSFTEDYLNARRKTTGNDENQAVPNGTARHTQSGYYEKPELWKDFEKLRFAAANSGAVFAGKKAELSTMEQKLKRQQKEAESLEGYLKHLQQQYASSRDESIRLRYDGIRQRYDQMQKEMRHGYLEYLAAYDSVRALQNSAQKADSDYRRYVEDQNKQYENWRSTVRDANTIQGEMDALDQQIHSQEDAEPWYENALLGGPLSYLLGGGASAEGQQARQDRQQKIRELQAQRTKLQEEYDWSKHFSYADLMNAENFDELSQYQSTANGRSRSPMDVMMGVYKDEDSGWDDPLYEHINGNAEASAYLSNKGVALYGDSEFGALLSRAADGDAQAKQMVEDEIKIFNYLYATQGKDAAHDYYDYLQSDLNYRHRKAAEQYWADYADESPVASSAFSVLTAPMKMMSFVGQTADMLDDGKMEENALYNTYVYSNNAIRNQVSEKIEKSGKWGKVGSFAYQTAMSMADFLFTTALSGGNSAMAMTIMGTSTAADTTLSAKDRGLSDAQAYTLGAVAGLAEAVTEKVSLDALLDKTSLGKSVAGYIGKNMLAEGSEEGASSLINLFADILISKDKSQWHAQVEAYKTQGLSEKEAFGKAFADQAAAIGLDVLGGALSGGIMGGGSAGIQKAGDHFRKTQQQSSDVDQTAPKTFQEDIQKQVTENMAGKKAGQGGTARLRDMQVQIDQTTFQQGQRLAQALGRDIEFYTEDGNENGYFENGVIYINTRGNDPLLQVFSHELTHSIEGAGSYGALSRIVLEQMEISGVDLDVARQAKRDLYARNNKQLKSQAEVDQELVAEYVSKHLLTDEAGIVSLVRKHRSLAQRIVNWFDKVLSLFGNKNAQERVFLERARDLYAKALEQTQGAAQMSAQAGDSAATVDELDALLAAGEITEEEYDQIRDALEQQEEEYTAGERQYSFAGEGAKTSNSSALADAMDKAKRGVDRETIRKETGWFQGVDGKWRFEIDDSSMRYHRAGDALFSEMHPDYARHQELEKKLLYGELAGFEEQEYRKLNEIWGNERQRLSDRVRRGNAMLQNVLQHDALFKAYPELRGTKVVFAEMGAGERGAYNPSNNTITISEDLRNSPEATLLHEIQHAIQHVEGFSAGSSKNFWMNQGMDEASAEGMYRNTAGEVEARDVANRRNMTTEERKNSPPDLGDENTMFAESSGITLDRDASEYPYDVQTVIREYMGAVDQDVLAFVNEVREGKAWNGKKITVGEADARFANDVRSILGIDVEIGSRILLTTNAVEHIEKRHGENGVHDQSMKNPSDLARIKYVIENYDNVEDGRKASGEYKNSDGTRARTVVLSKKINGTYFVVEAVPNTGKVGVVSAYISKKGTSQVPDASTPSRDAQNELASVPEKKVPQQNRDVKQKFSLNSDTVSKKDVARDLQGILSRGGDAAELRRYVAQLERSGRSADQTGGKAEQTGSEAEQIVKAARKRGLSVEEYLRENAELYDVDGQWNPDARKALEMDKKGNRQYSISETTEEANSQADARSTMPKKAKATLDSAEQVFLKSAITALHVPNLVAEDYLNPIIQEFSDRYLENGTVTQEQIDLLFDKAYANGVVACKDYLDQYADVSEKLHNLALTPTDAEWNSIFNGKEFRDFAKGNIRIVADGGMTVAEAYKMAQSMHKDLFPEALTTARGQAHRLVYAVRNARLASERMEQIKRGSEDLMRQSERGDFASAVSGLTGELWRVRRYVMDKAAKENEKPPATATEAMEAYKELKRARRNYERAAAKNLLTDYDEMQVGRLLKHEIELEHLDPEKCNVKGITAVYEAKQEYEQLCKLLGAYKKHVRGQLRKKADQYLETANNWKDKKTGILYARETMRRNIYDIVPDRKLAAEILDEFFEPVHICEAEANRFKNRYRDRVRALQLSTKVAMGNLVSEAHAVQLLGEAEDNIRMLENARGRIKSRDGKNLTEWQAVIQKLWDESPNLNKAKIDAAVKEFRKIYDELFEQMNQVRVANGYEPVNYRNGYFPHFQPGDSDSILVQFGKALGIDTQVNALPTTINGLTHTFKPGIQWFGNAQERLGFNTAYDAVEGFDKYIEGVASVIHHTENIQKLRALATQIRYRTSEKGIREQVDAVYTDPRYSEDEKQVMITEIYAHGKFALSNFVTELDEYTNLLANKKSKYDRTIEAMMGRRAYTIMKAWEARVGANMIAGNLTSALTNFIPLTQAGAQLDRFSLLRGMWGTLQAYRNDDGIVGMSSFLTNRRGSDPLVKKWTQKASGILGTPMELIDNFTADSIIRGAYYQNLKRGMSEAEAMHQADIFASNVMADRSKGSMPTVLQASNPLFKAFTQFQLEVNNQFSEVFKDLPRGFKEKGLKALAWVLLKYFLGAFLFNELYEKLIGRRPALDPIGILCDAMQDVREDGIRAAGANLAGNILEQLPFTAGLSLIGIEIDGGRIPASSAVPDLTALWDAATTEGWSAEKRWKEIQDELNKLAYVLPPFAGNQISKLWKGIKAYAEGGSYTVNAEGKDILQYPVYKDDPEDAFWSLIRAALLGKSSLPEAQDWVDNGFDSLNDKQTAAYQDMLAAGVKDRDAYALVKEIGSAQKTDTKSKASIQIDILRNSTVSDEGKAILYYGLVASEKERELMDSLADMGADAGAVGNALMGMREAGALTGSTSTNAKYEAIRKAALTDDEKAVLIGSIMGTDFVTESGGITQYAKFSYAVQNGMRVDQYIEYRNSGASIDHYLQLRDAGHSVEDAMEAGMALQELKESMEDPTTVQKWRTVIDSTDDIEKQLISLSIVMTDSQYCKLQTAHDFGITPSTYVKVHEMMLKYDADGNGAFAQAEISKAIAAMRCSTAQKAVLWQLATGSKSAKNNPYSSTIGQKVINALEAAKANQKESGPTFEEEILRQLMGE